MRFFSPSFLLFLDSTLTELLCHSRDVLVLVAFIVGFAGLLVAAVLAKMRELR